MAIINILREDTGFDEIYLLQSTVPEAPISLEEGLRLGAEESEEGEKIVKGRKQEGMKGGREREGGSK